jgi:hypothetical protein
MRPTIVNIMHLRDSTSQHPEMQSIIDTSDGEPDSENHPSIPPVETMMTRREVDGILGLAIGDTYCPVPRDFIISLYFSAPCN